MAQKSNAQIISEWNSRVKAKEDNGYSRPDAVRACVHADPEFHQKYLAAYKAEAAAGNRPLSYR